MVRRRFLKIWRSFKGFGGGEGGCAWYPGMMGGGGG